MLHEPAMFSKGCMCVSAPRAAPPAAERLCTHCAQASLESPRRAPSQAGIKPTAESHESSSKLRCSASTQLNTWPPGIRADSVTYYTSVPTPGPQAQRASGRCWRATTRHDVPAFAQAEPTHTALHMQASSEHAVNTLQTHSLHEEPGPGLQVKMPSHRCQALCPSALGQSRPSKCRKEYIHWQARQIKFKPTKCCRQGL